MHTVDPPQPAQARSERRSSPARLRRLKEELDEELAAFGIAEPFADDVLCELDYALRPPVHERRVPSYGAFVGGAIDEARWIDETSLSLVRHAMAGIADRKVRRFADGLSSWVHRSGDVAELIVLDRPAGSERDLTVLARASGATVVQRHPSGLVRVVCEYGVVRWDGLTWHFERAVSAWIDTLSACDDHGDREVLSDLLEFAVHDLGARRVGALLVYRAVDDPWPDYELRMPQPPPLHIRRPEDLAPLGHVLEQIDGAAIFDHDGTLRHLGVRLVPTGPAEAAVDAIGGTRHTAARRYSFDDAAATVIAVSEDGPVTVFRRGHILGRSRSDPPGALGLVPDGVDHAG